MESKEIDKKLTEVLESAFENSESALLSNVISSCSNEENLKQAYLKIGAEIYTCTDVLPDKENILTNVLDILLDLIEIYGINESMREYLGKPILFLIVDENCNIINIKKAIHIFNLLLQLPSIISNIIKDEALEGSLQILGRRIPMIGDYECQALIFESLYRITCDENREYWVNVWFPDEKSKSMFLNLDPKKFELDCRKTLNYINRNEPERKVYSFIAHSVSFGSFQLKEPYGCEFWIDFNYASKSISFYCSEFTSGHLHEDSAVWETVVIPTSAIDSCFMREAEEKNLKELVLLLNCPCSSLITSSSVSDIFESHQITITFWGILNICQHLQNIYGKNKFVEDEAATDKCKSGNSTAAQDTEKSLELFQEKDSEKKIILDISNSIPAVTEENSLQPGGIVSQRKVSVSEPISICASDDVDIIPETNEIIKKVSTVSDVIKIPSPEHIACVNQKNRFKKASESSEIIQFQVQDHTLSESQIKSNSKRILDSSEIIPAQAYVDHVLSESKNKARKVSESSEIIPTLVSDENIELEVSDLPVVISSEALNENETVQNLDTNNAINKNADLRITKDNKRKIASYDPGTDDEDYEITHCTFKKKRKVKHKFKKKAASQDICENTSNFENAENVNYHKNDSPVSNNQNILLQVKSPNQNTHKDNQNDISDSIKNNEFLPPNMIINKPIDMHEEPATRFPIENQNIEDIKKINQTSNQRDISKSSEIENNETNENKLEYSLNNSEDLNKHLFPVKDISQVNETSNENVHLESKNNLLEVDTSSNNFKKIRLYNPDTAPVYDVPPSLSSQDHKKDSIKSHIVNANHKDAMLKAKIENKTIDKPNTVKRYLSSSKSRKIDKGKINNMNKELPESDEDFKSHSRRVSNESEEVSKVFTPVSKNVKKGETESSYLQPNRQDSNDMVSGRKPRKAAMNARKKNKKIFDTKSEVIFDDTESKPLVSSLKSHVRNSTRRKRGLKEYTLYTDGETGSSEVSWLNKNKSCPLFETPKRSYSKWKKSKRRSLPVQVTAYKAKSTPNVLSTGAKKRKHDFKTLSIGSGSKSKSTHGLSDLDNFELVIEKNKKRESAFIKGLESDFHSMSSTSFKKSSSRKNNSVFLTNKDKNVNLRNFERNEEEMEDLNNNEIPDIPPDIDDNNNNEICPSHFNEDQLQDMSINKEECLNNISNTIEKNRSCVSEIYECDLIQVPDENNLLENESEKGSRESVLGRSSVDVNTDLSTIFPDEGKQIHLNYFLDCVAEYYQSKSHKESVSSKSKESNELLNTEAMKRLSSVESCVPNVSLSDISHKKEINTSKYYDSEHNSLILESTASKKKRKIEVSEPAYKRKRVEEPISGNNFSYDNQSKIWDQTAVSSKYSSLPVKADKNIQNLDTGVSRKKKVYDFTSAFKTANKHINKSEDHERSRISSHSKQSLASLTSTKYNKSWFDAIFTSLSAEANKLTQKLLATVQKYLNEYTSKINLLRLNIIKAAYVLGKYSSQKVNEITLKNLIRSCRTSRIEVEKSLNKMHLVAKEYFETEELILRKLRNKHIKASKKYITSMLNANKVAVTKMERSLLLQLKSFTKRFVKHINSS